jgi:hypothetical protein
MTGTVIAEVLGLPGNGRRVTFGVPHVLAGRDGLIGREQIWIDRLVPRRPAHRRLSSEPPGHAATGEGTG